MGSRVSFFWLIAMESRENDAISLYLSLFRGAQSISKNKILVEEELRDRYVQGRLKDPGTSLGRWK